MPGSDDLDNKFKAIHDKITGLYYGRGKGLAKNLFDRLHTACWLYHEKGLMDAGYKADFIVEGVIQRSTEVNNLLADTAVALPELEAYL